VGSLRGKWGRKFCPVGDKRDRNTETAEKGGKTRMPKKKKDFCCRGNKGETQTGGGGEVEGRILPKTSEDDV